MSDKHPCKIGENEFDHDWQYISDWSGDPGVINGTFDCSYWQCLVCDEECHDREPPGYEPLL